MKSAILILFTIGSLFGEDFIESPDDIAGKEDNQKALNKPLMRTFESKHFKITQIYYQKDSNLFVYVWHLNNLIFVYSIIHGNETESWSPENNDGEKLRYFTLKEGVNGDVLFFPVFNDKVLQFGLKKVANGRCFELLKSEELKKYQDQYDATVTFMSPTVPKGEAVTP